MEQADKLFKDISKRSSRLVSILQSIKEKSEFYDKTCEKWEKICLDIPDQINKGLIKVAVAGAVKSGKSTFINSIFQADFLKRGAGVVTSVVTKIRRQDTLKAKLLIKSWDEINLEIEEVLLSFDDDCLNKHSHFDLRREKDRKCLINIYETLSIETSFTDNQVKPEIIFLNNVLKNYEFCKDFIKPDEFLLELKKDRFSEHKFFTGDPSKAFFIKDAILEIDFGNIDQDIEIADCQGIDSTDTAQLSQVLEYLESSNMIIYLISSRTGLREADMRFLSIINKMGIGDNVVFVVNCDLSEHESLNDLNNVENKIQQDLLYFKQDLNFFSFSSLYNLFNQNKLQLTKKDEKRVQVWETDKKIIKYSNDMTEKFFIDFENRIKKDRINLIFANPMQRLLFISKGLQKKVELFSAIYSEDKNLANKALLDLQDIQAGIIKIQVLVENSMNGISQELEKEIFVKIDNYFNNEKDSIINSIIFFINSYAVHFNKFKDQILTSSFPKALYLLFQDFKKEFDLYLVEKINPELVRFIKEQENALESQAVSLYNSYKIDSFDLYNKLEKMSSGFFDINADILNIINVQSVKKRLGIRPPSATFTTQYSARIKISTFTGFGIYSLLMVFIKTVGKESKVAMTPLLKKASLRFKKEVLRSIKFQLNEYKKKVKNEYFGLLIRALSKEINEIIIDQFSIFSVEIDNIRSKLKKEKSENSKEKELLQSISKEIEEILQKTTPL